MRIKITERHLKHIHEVLGTSYDTNPEDINRSYKDDKHYKWFDHVDPDFLKSNPSVTSDQIENSLMYTIQYLKNIFRYDLKRVVIKDNDNVVAFLIYSNTNSEKELMDNEGVPYTVLLATAVHPDYRNKGLLKGMINSAGIQKPYLVHTSPISTPKVWEKMGCQKVVDRGNGNQVEKCN